MFKIFSLFFLFAYFSFLTFLGGDKLITLVGILDSERFFLSNDLIDFAGDKVTILSLADLPIWCSFLRFGV
jgi:hypothetical protein